MHLPLKPLTNPFHIIFPHSDVQRILPYFRLDPMKSLIINYLPRKFNSIIRFSLIASGKIEGRNLSIPLTSQRHHLLVWVLGIFWRREPSPRNRKVSIWLRFPQPFVPGISIGFPPTCKISVDYQDYKEGRWKLNILKQRKMQIVIW